MKQEEIEVCEKAFDILVARKGIAGCDEYKPVFKELGKAVGKAIVDRINKIDLSQKRCVLLVGKDDTLIRGIACYLYYHYGLDYEAFYYMDYLLERDFIKREGLKY